MTTRPSGPLTGHGVHYGRKNTNSYCDSTIVSHNGIRKTQKSQRANLYWTFGYQDHLGGLISEKPTGP